MPQPARLPTAAVSRMATISGGWCFAAGVFSYLLLSSFNERYFISNFLFIGRHFWVGLRGSDFGSNCVSFVGACHFRLLPLPATSWGIFSGVMWLGRGCYAMISYAQRKLSNLQMTKPYLDRKGLLSRLQENANGKNILLQNKQTEVICFSQTIQSPFVGKRAIVSNLRNLFIFLPLVYSIFFIFSWLMCWCNYWNEEITLPAVIRPIR